MHWWQTISRLSIHEVEEEDLEDVGEGGEDPTEVASKPGGGGPSIPGLDRNVLPEELRDLSEAEIKFHLNQMVSAVRGQNDKVSALRQELDEIRRGISEKPKEPPRPEKPLEEEILEDPEAAVVRVLQKRGFIDRFSRMDLIFPKPFLR